MMARLIMLRLMRSATSLFRTVHQLVTSPSFLSFLHRQRQMKPVSKPRERVMPPSIIPAPCLHATRKYYFSDYMRDVAIMRLGRTPRRSAGQADSRCYFRPILIFGGELLYSSQAYAGHYFLAGRRRSRLRGGQFHGSRHFYPLGAFIKVASAARRRRRFRRPGRPHSTHTECALVLQKQRLPRSPQDTPQVAFATAAATPISMHAHVSFARRRQIHVITIQASYFAASPQEIRA